MKWIINQGLTYVAASENINIKPLLQDYERADSVEAVYHVGALKFYLWGVWNTEQKTHCV